MAKITTKPTPHVFSTLDGLRGVAAIFVVIRHFGPLFGKAMEFQESFLAVDLFFLLSGAVITHAYERRLQSGLSVLQFAYLRMVRIYPLYILGSTIALVTTLSGLNGNGPVSHGHLLLYCVLGLMMLPNLMLSEPDTGKPALFPFNGPAWSLFSELAANIFYAAALRFLSMRVLVAIMAVSALGMVACMYISPSHSLDIGWTAKSLPGGLVRVGYSFFAGVFLYRQFVRRRSRPVTGRHTKFIPYALLGVVAIILTASPSGAFQSYFDFFAVVAVFPVIIYLGLMFQPEGAGARICKFVGAISYAVYVTQGPLAGITQGVLRAANGISVERHLPWAGLDFVYDYAPWAGFGFLALLLPFCWCLDQAYDGPVRHYLLKLRPRVELKDRN